ncbi:MAG: DUF192 domain-containing protein [Paracoccaceae bacterium]|nr:DUF192 domain-containing protein [Paracoccaceae bacterium]
MRLGFSQRLKIASWTNALLLSGMLASTAAAGCSDNIVRLRGDWGTVRFGVEVADTEAKRSHGLMHRDHLAARSGMLFIYSSPQAVTFWMRNTQISLDMLFVDFSGTVRHIHHQAQPWDETPIVGGDSVLAVIEINGGLAKDRGITVGSQLQSPLLPQKFAAWPCE